MRDCRAAEEADSQALRTAILLDELDRPEIGENDTRIGNIITELKACSHTCQSSLKHTGLDTYWHIGRGFGS